MSTMRLMKIMLAVNAVTLVMNGVIVWLVLTRTFPFLLGVVVVGGCLAGAVWGSCYVNGALPKQRRHAFYSAQTERVERV